jgi:predicted membrane-bound mannosyltransferase
MQPRRSIASVKTLLPILSTGIFVEGIILVLAALLRLWGLDEKPAHFDEGINGWFVDQMRAHGFYRYDPENYHGPVYFYVLFVSLSLLGRNLWALRLLSDTGTFLCQHAGLVATRLGDAMMACL